MKVVPILDKIKTSGYLLYIVGINILDINLNLNLTQIHLSQIDLSKMKMCMVHITFFEGLFLVDNQLQVLIVLCLVV